MTSPASSSSPPHAEAEATSSSIHEDLLDLDFSDSPPTSANTSTFPLLPSPHISPPPNTAGSWNDWQPMTPDVAVKVSSPKIVIAPEKGNTEEGGTNEEAEQDLEKPKDNPASRDDVGSPESSPSNGSTTPKTPLKASASDSGDTSSSNLSAIATPFKSNVVRVAPSSAPHSFFPHHATAHINTSLPGTPHLGQQSEVDITEGVTSPLHSGPKESAKVATRSESNPLSKAGSVSSPNRTLTPSKIPHSVPLPDSQPASTNSRSSHLINSPSQLIKSPPRQSTPLSALVRSMSQFSLTEKGEDIIPNTDLLPRQLVEAGTEKEDPVSSGTADRSPTRALEDLRLYEGMPQMTTGQAELNQAGMIDSLQEMGELEKNWADYRESVWRFAGGMDEVIARLSYNLTGHCCTATDHAEDLRLARLEIIQLQRKVRDLQEAKSAKSSTHHDEEEVIRLQNQCAEITKECKRLEAKAEKAALREELWRSKYEKSESNYAKLVDDRAHWHERETILGKSWLELEEQLRLVTSELSRREKGMGIESGRSTRQADIRSPTAKFGAILIEFTATVIDEAYIKRGADGGKELGENILMAVMPQGEGLVIAQVFLNFPDLKKKLSLSYAIKKEADLHDFLDGFRSVSGLFTVVDTESPAGKMEDHLKLYKVLGAAKIILVSRRPQPYRDVIDTLSDRKEIYAVRDGESQDPFDFLGEDRLVSIDGLLKPVETRKSPPNVNRAPSEPTPLPKRASAASVSTTSTTAEAEQEKPPHLRAIPSISSISDKSDGWREPEPVPSSSRNRRNPVPLTPPSDIRPAPWAAPAATLQRRPRVSSIPATGRLGTPGTPWWEQGGTMNDEAQSMSSRRASVSSATNSERSPPGTPRASAQTPNRPPLELVPDRPPVDKVPSNRAPPLQIHVKDIGSVAGSPADSDEDHPNVDLPHSAVKWVQRPIEFSQESTYTPSQGPRSPSTSVSSSSITGEQAYAARAQLVRQSVQRSSSTTVQRGHGQFRASSVTGTNSAPLGQPKSGGTGTAGKVHGFNVHGRK